MAAPYVFLHQRLVDILINGRGATGLLGTEAQERSIAAGYFRTEFQQSPLTSPGYAKEYFDRALRIEWSAELDDLDRNPCDAEQILSARITIAHGVVFGDAAQPFLQPTTPSTPAVAILQPQQRALSDARLVRRALECPDLLRDGTETDPVPIGCEREGSATLQELGGGKLLVTSAFVLTYRASDV